MTTDPVDAPGVVVPPPLLYLGALGLGVGLEWLWPMPLASAGLPTSLRLALGAILSLLGAAVLATAVRRLRRADTNVPTTRPTTAIVVDGPYRCSRNPIYVAMSSIYIGLAVLANSLWALVLLAPVLFVLRYGVIAREEQYLKAKFGDEYRRYRAAVRRWL